MARSVVRWALIAAMAASCCEVPARKGTWRTPGQRVS
jgi:hypothetical protein